MRKRFAFYLVILLNLVGLVALSPSMAFASSSRNSAHTLPGKLAQVSPVKVLDISADYARQMVAKYGDPSVVAHMLVVDTQPLPARSTSKEIFGTPVLSATPTWEGYDADLLSTPYYATLIRAHITAEHSSCSCTVGAWVGIGGVHASHNLFQVGIDMVNMKTFLDVIEPGWSPVAEDFRSVRQGDDIYGQVNLDTSTGDWFWTVGDVTTNQFNSGEAAVFPDQNSAEWIVEVEKNPEFPIPFFSGVQFSHAQFSTNTGASGYITNILSNPTYEAIIGPNNNTCWASPGPVSSDGQSFFGRDFC